MDTMRNTLVILSPGFPANEADSTCMPFPQLFVRTLKKLDPGLDIIVLAFQYPYTKTDYVWHGIKVIPFNGQNKGKLRRMMVWRSVWKKLSILEKENKIQGILNFWLGECALIGKYAAKKYGIKTFTWLLGQDARANNRYYRFIHPTPKELIALSDSIADEFENNYRLRPATIVPPGIDINSFRTGVTVRDIDIMGAGSLIPLKQFEIFITVVAQLVKSRPNIKTVICGDGPEREKLQQMITTDTLQKNITLCGELPHHAILEMMQRTTIFLHPSSYEGFATVLSEALYAGAHVVGFCQPMKKTFPRQYTVKTNAAMLDTVIEVLDNTNRNHDSVITYTIEDTCKKILQLYMD